MDASLGTRLLAGVLRAQETAAEPVTVGGVTVTPMAWTLVVRAPWGALVWNRPAAVLVERDGQVRRIPIVDVTRFAQAGLIGAALAITIGGLLRAARRKEGTP